MIGIEPKLKSEPTDIIEEFHHRPSVAAYMTRALLPSPGFRAGGPFPRIVERWSNIRIDGRHLRAFLEMTGLPAGDGTSKLASWPGPAAALLYPHVFGFPLIMSLVTHRVFPFPIWGALQIRNHFLLHRPYSEHEVLDMVIRTAGQRILPKGMDVDLHTTLSASGELVWEGLTTFYYRGNYGREQTASPLARSLSGDRPEVTRWSMPSNVYWRFAGLTGDYNGIHWWNWWARRLGFKSALYHSQLVVGQCLARLASPAGNEQRLDIWLKGQVYHHASVRLEATGGSEARWFTLIMDGNKLPSMIGRWSDAAPGSRLLDDQNMPHAIEGPA